MMVVFLAGLVSMILMRTLRNDYAKYARDGADDVEDGGVDQGASMEESGWKLVHGDVFRAPRHLPALSALIGTGCQMALLILLVILITIAGMLYEGRGTIITVFITCYALTSFVGGYVSGGYNARNEGKSWIKAMLLTAGLFPGMCFGIAFALNTVAIGYHSLAAVPFGTMVVIFVMWSCISFPLVLFGTVIGRNWSGAPDNPCRVKAIPRPIPEAPWFLTPNWISLLGGLLPFGSIFIETYFVFTSIWYYKVYYVYGFFLLVFLHLGHRHAVHHDRRYLLFAQRGEPQVAVDGVQLRRVRRGLRVPVQRLLLRVQDEDDGFLPDVLLFRVHGDVLPGAGDHHRGDRLLRRERVRAEDL